MSFQIITTLIVLLTCSRKRERLTVATLLLHTKGCLDVTVSATQSCIASTNNRNLDQ